MPAPVAAQPGPIQRVTSPGEDEGVSVDETDLDMLHDVQHDKNVIRTKVRSVRGGVTHQSSHQLPCLPD